MAKKMLPILQADDGWTAGHVVFSEAEIAELSDCLASAGAADLPAALVSLRDTCAAGRYLYQLASPSAAQERAAIHNIQQLAEGLADAIRRADDTTRAHLDEIAHFYMTDCGRMDDLAAQLQGLAAGAGARLSAIPKTYGRGPAAVEQVRMIRAALVQCGVNIPVNRWAGSEFSRVVTACFSAMKIPAGPEHAIRKYQENHNGE